MTYGCNGRAPLADTAVVQDGWTSDNRRQMVDIPDPMTKDCQYRKDVLSKTDKGCDGCPWRDA